MWHLLKRKNMQRADDCHGAVSKLAGLLVEKVLVIQKMWANWMNRKINHYPAKTKRTALIGMVLFVGVYCCYLLISSFSGSPLETVEQPGKIMPGIIHKNDDAIQIDLDTAVQQKIVAFRHYLDSLNQTEAGRKEKDSLLKARPGLIDSLTLLEELIKNN